MKMIKRIMSMILVIAMLTSSMELFTANAATSSSQDTVITVEETYASPGSTIDVNVNIENNPGILGATLIFTYDAGLTLTKAVAGTAFSALTMTKPAKFSSPSRFVWDGQDLADSQIKDGCVITLTFEVGEDVEVGKPLNIGVSYDKGDIVDRDLNIVDLDTVAGQVSIIDYTPGDLNGDTLVNATDIILSRRHITQSYNLSIREEASDVNADGRINTTDVILIRRYIAGGYGVKLLPGLIKCNHVMEYIEKKDATCTENGNIAYYYCSVCEKYYLDEEGISKVDSDKIIIEAGHTLTHVEAKAATTEEEGCIEHWKCSVCEKYFANSSGTEEMEEEDVIIPTITKVESTVVYNVFGSDSYLESVGVDNSNNPTTFYSEDGLVLNDIVAPAGYVFKGWTTASGSPITEIAPSTTSRQIVVNATWEKVEYTVTFDSPDCPVDSVKYTVDTGITLKNPQCYGYTFVGWSNDNGFLVNSIKPGTTGNITLHANWTSNRNRATSYSEYGDPIIIEDDNSGQFLFVYDIGRIDNVPLYTYIDEATGTTIGANGTALNIDMEYQVKEEFNETEAKEMIETVANATTRSSGWTLSKEWNELYEEGSEYSDKQIKSEERTDSQGNIVGGKYFVSNSQGGSSFVSTESGGSTSNSSKVTTDDSFGINSSYDKSTETYGEATLGVKNETEASAGIEVPVKIAKVSAGVKNTTTVSAEATVGRKDNEAFHVDSSLSSYVGTVNTSDSSAYYNTVANQSSNWNSTTGYEKSYQTSTETTISQAIANEIQKTTSYNVSKALGGENSQNESVSGTTSSEQGYSNSIQVGEYHSKTTTKHVKYTNPDIGYYRVVMAGTVHVYGVVGYDVATASYYTYTYNVLADDTFEYVDYSKKRATFDDCENGVVTFEVPYDINEYVLGVTSETEGLEIGLDGTVNQFEVPEDFDGTVVVPQYHADTQPGTDNVAIKTTAISSEAFKNKEEIKTVILPTYVTEIPANAFEGCTNLETVIAYGVTKIGENAFKGCESLKKFSIDNFVDELGTNAFEGVPEIEVMAYDADVADAAIASGAKRITVNISKIKDTYDNKTVTVGDTTDYFAIVGNGGEYKNLQINSAAGETLISNIKFVNDNDTPLKLSSPTVTLSVVSVESSPVYALQLSNENTDLKLYGEINMNSSGDNTVISKNVTLSKANNNITSKLNLSGNYLVCGEVINKESFLNVEPISITSEEYEIYTSPCVITYEANGGEEIDTTKIVYTGQAYGELPTPEREYFAFLGWYTEAEGGELVSADTVVEATTSQTLYAQWEAITSTLIFDANGGEVDTENKIVYLGESIGELPIPTRENCTFDGWYTEDGMIVDVDTVFTVADSITLRAHWQSSDWVLATELPEDGSITSEKWTYTLREYTTNSASSLSGWTKYDTKRTSWGSWSSWSTTNPTNGVRNVQSRSVYDHTEYHYYRWTNGSGSYTYQYNSSYWLEEKWFTYILPTSQYGTSIGYVGSDIGKNLWTRADYSGNYSVGKTWSRAINRTEWRYQEPVYTYYYYRDVSKETTEADPTGQSNVSNVVKYVQYSVQ